MVKNCSSVLGVLRFYFKLVVKVKLSNYLVNVDCEIRGRSKGDI